MVAGAEGTALLEEEELLTNPDAWVALLTLTALEIVLGIDNIVFIAILASRLPVEQQGLAYRLGLLGLGGRPARGGDR